MYGLIVRIHRDDDGCYYYPPFERLPTIIHASQDWREFIDKDRGGWIYDAASHTLWGDHFAILTTTSKSFVDEAVNRFAARCILIANSELKRILAECDSSGLGARTLSNLQQRVDSYLS